MKTEKMRLTYLPLVMLALLVLSVLCRGMGYIYSTMATDIAYSDLTVSIMGILVEGLTILRTVTGYCAILYAMYRWERDCPVRYRCGGLITAAVLVCDLLDCFSRYLVDRATSSITDMEVMAVLWLAMQFCYSMILVILCWCTGSILFRPSSARPGRTPERVLTQSVLYLLGSRLILEIIYLLDFLTAYSGITASEISSIIGQFLYTLVLYGGIAWGIAMGLLVWLKHTYGTPEAALPQKQEHTAESGADNA